eukprot:Opistho-2@6116
MGFNSWYALGCDRLSGNAAIDIGKEMKTLGLVDAGYSYFVLDDCWENATRDADDMLQPDPVKFPMGMRAVSDSLRSLGLTLGLYSTPGVFTCMHRPASRYHEEKDAHQLIENWGVGYFKYCVCNTTREWRQTAYGVMLNALRATGREIMYECDPWMDKPWEWMGPICNLWAAHDDIPDNFTAWTAALDDLEDWDVRVGSGPGHWSLPDFLQIGNGGQSEDEYRAQFAIYCILASPLFVSTDFRSAPAYAAEIYRHRAAIAINQDPLGIQGARVWQARKNSTDDPTAEVWARPLDGGRYAAVLFNRGNATVTVRAAFDDISSFSWGDNWQAHIAGLPRTAAGGVTSSFKYALVRDVWSGVVLGLLPESVQLDLAPHAAAFFEIAPVFDA